jgi:mycothiol system anti-sigma-R factor
LAKIDRYTCEETFRRLDDYLDRELDAAELRLVREHLESCALCASEFTFEETLLSGIRAKLRRITLPPGLRERVLRSLDAADAGDRRRHGTNTES